MGQTAYYMSCMILQNAYQVFCGFYGSYCGTFTTYLQVIWDGTSVHQSKIKYKDRGPRMKRILQGRYMKEYREDQKMVAGASIVHDYRKLLHQFGLDLHE